MPRAKPKFNALTPSQQRLLLSLPAVGFIETFGAQDFRTAKALERRQLVRAQWIGMRAGQVAITFLGRAVRCSICNGEPPRAPAPPCIECGTRRKAQTQEGL